jgi:hypothetical protein
LQAETRHEQIPLLVAKGTVKPDQSRFLSFITPSKPPILQGQLKKLT